MSARSEAPTPRRLEEARKKGQFARSPSFTAWASMLGGGLGLLLALRRALEETFACARAAWLLGQRPEEAALLALNCLCWWVVPTGAGAFLGALGAAGAQAGWHPQPGLLRPDFSRLSSAQGLRRLFSLERLGSVLRAAAFAGIVTWAWLSHAVSAVPDLLRASTSGAGAWAWLSWQVLRGLVQAVLLWGAVYIAVEYLLSRRRHLHQMRMTRDEVRREYRESEGDPLVKGQRRAIHRALAQGGPARGLAQANALVVNPTHFAVALRYVPGECEAPYVVARGHDRDALALRLEAESMGLPIVRDVPLARSLIRLELGEEIPEELFHAAAAVLKVAQEGVRL